MKRQLVGTIGSVVLLLAGANSAEAGGCFFNFCRQPATSSGGCEQWVWITVTELRTRQVLDRNGNPVLGPDGKPLTVTERVLVRRLVPRTMAQTTTVADTVTVSSQALADIQTDLSKVATAVGADQVMIESLKQKLDDILRLLQNPPKQP